MTSKPGMVGPQLVPVGMVAPMFVWTICRAWSISGSMNGSIVAIRVASSMDSLKFPVRCVAGVMVSPLDVVMSRVTLRVAVVEFRSVTIQPKVPLMLRLGEIIAIIGQTIPALRVELRIGAQD